MGSCFVISNKAASRTPRYTTTPEKRFLSWTEDVEPFLSGENLFRPLDVGLGGGDWSHFDFSGKGRGLLSRSSRLLLSRASEDEYQQFCDSYTCGVLLVLLGSFFSGAGGVAVQALLHGNASDPCFFWVRNVQLASWTIVVGSLYQATTRLGLLYVEV